MDMGGLLNQVAAWSGSADASPYPDAVNEGTETSGASGSFSIASGWDTMRAACAIAEFDTDQARLIRLGENALFHLPAAGVVVRIARTMSYWADSVKEVNVANWLADNQFPAAQAYDVSQPVAVAEHPVTFWRFIAGRAGDQRDIVTLGGVLRRLHQTQPPTTFTLPPEDILGRVKPRIASGQIPDSDKEFLLDLLSDLTAKVSNLEYPLSPAPTHGDAHTENLMIHDDQPVLIDFERFAWGQPEWDLAMTATEHLTAKWWTDDQYAKFCDAYGYDVTEWTGGFDVLRAVHELKMTTWLMQNVAESQEIADEYQSRMRTLRGEPSPGWHPF
ncbi:MAG TPA: aminoglycoside phosphotransferase family protein [Pseudonocardiaceae bacterium]|nr:aminoglycoside phosphotransferase family protein [Pseudonocardiaceae bacterium]